MITNVESSKSIPSIDTNAVTKHAEFMGHHFYHMGTGLQGVLADIDKSELKEAIVAQGGLSASQMTRLVRASDRFVSWISSTWGLNFRIVNGALPCVDPVSRHPGANFGETWKKFTDLTSWLNSSYKAQDYTGAVLMHERPRNEEEMMRGSAGKLAITGGGFADHGETLIEAAKRELYEESGGGYIINDVHPVMIRDILPQQEVGESKEQRMSFVFAGTLQCAEGQDGPIANDEARRFAFITPEVLAQLPEEVNFAGHFQLIDRCFHYSMTDTSLYCSSQDKDYDPAAFCNSIRKRIQAEREPNAKVNKSIDLVEEVLQRLSCTYNDFVQVHIPQEERSVKNSQLWEWLKSMKLGISTLSSLFQGESAFRLLPREGGGISVAALVTTRDSGGVRLAIQRDESGKCILPETDHQHGEVLSQTLLRLGLEEFSINLDPASSSVFTVHDEGQEGDDGIPRRAVLMQTVTEDLKESDSVSLVRAVDLSLLGPDAWARPEHYAMVRKAFDTKGIELSL